MWKLIKNLNWEKGRRKLIIKKIDKHFWMKKKIGKCFFFYSAMKSSGNLHSHIICCCAKCCLWENLYFMSGREMRWGWLQEKNSYLKPKGITWKLWKLHKIKKKSNKIHSIAWIIRQQRRSFLSGDFWNKSLHFCTRNMFRFFFSYF